MNEHTWKTARRLGRFALVAVGLASSLALAQPDKKTERTWKAKCASCHGADGKAQTEQGKKMKTADITTAEWQKSFTDEQLKKAVLEGIKREKDGVKQEMDGYKDSLKPEQVDALVQYMRVLGPKP
jgi:mono/diheme cytochrome c family protein